MRFERLKPWQRGNRKKGMGIRTNNYLSILIHLHPKKKLIKIKDRKDI